MDNPGRVMVKAIAIFALVLLPLGATLWHRSHAAPGLLRYDVTLYKSLWVWMRDGYCTMHLLSMPTKTASRTEHRASLSYDPRPQNRSLFMHSSRTGPFHNLWIVFPLWILPVGLIVLGVVPLGYGPLRVWRRRRAGRCVDCGYNLLGNRSGRCPECGARPAARRRTRTLRTPSANAGP